MSKYAKDEILSMLSSGSLTEGESVEFKEQWHQEHGKDISSIGNGANRGWLIVGVNDRGEMSSRAANNWAKDQKNKIENHVNQYLNPSSAVQFISIENVGNKHCVLIEIMDPGHPVSWNQQFYKRIGANTSQMSPGEVKSLELKKPGLDFSSFMYKGGIDSALVLDFANFLPKDNGNWTALSADEILSKLDIKNKNTAGILFGDFPYRLIHYRESFEPLDQKDGKGLYHILQNNFIDHIQSWTRKKAISLKPDSLSVMEETPYPEAVLREVFVNAIAHSAFEKQVKEVKVELYKNRITVSNHCASEVKDFIISKKFSKEHFSHNPLLMKILRTAKFSDDLGTGKNKIFKIMIESGRREPLFEYQKISNNYGTLSVTIYNEQPNKHFLNLLERFKNMYSDNKDKYKISAALVLWKDKSLEEIFSFMDQYHIDLTLDILKEERSPFLVVKEKSKNNKESLRILLKRWVKNQIEGQKSKVFSIDEERRSKAFLQNYAYKDGREGFITNKEARHLLGLAVDSQSEAVQLSKMFQKWKKEGFLENVEKRGYWKIKRKQKKPFVDIISELESYLQSTNKGE